MKGKGFLILAPDIPLVLHLKVRLLVFWPTLSQVILPMKKSFFMKIFFFFWFNLFGSIVTSQLQKSDPKFLYNFDKWVGGGKDNFWELIRNYIDWWNRTELIRHLCRKTTVLSCHKCRINSGVEIINNNEICIRILTPGANVIKLFTALSYDFS